MPDDPDQPTDDPRPDDPGPAGERVSPDLDDQTRREALELALLDEGASEAGEEIDAAAG